MDRHDTLLLACGTGENRKQLRSVLEEHYHLLEAANTRQALLLLEQNISCIAAVLVDISVPKTVDRELLTSEDFLSLEIPLMVVTPDDSAVSLHSAFELGAVDAISLDYDSYGMLQRIENIVQLSLHKRNLESMVEEQSRILRNSNNAIVDALSSIIEYRSVESGQHILRIRHFTKILLEELQRCCPEYGLTESVIGLIASASALHDIGKISIPDAILTKPGKLTGEEMEVMRSHALTGSRILQRLGDLGDPEYMRYAHNICQYHHERWDGSGYPEGLRGDEIPICAQVVGIADVYDALTTTRVYKAAYPFDTAVNMILNGECGEFSPKLLECFKHVTDQYETLARAYADGLSPNSENFDVTLPAPERASNDSMERTWSKYQALVHYADALLIELDLDQKLYHLVYNPYPEFAALQDVNNFGDMATLILDQLIVPEQRGDMEALFSKGIDEFVRNGLRRVNYRFRFRSRMHPEGEDFLLTLLRIRPTDSVHNTLAVLCRKETAAAQSVTEFAAAVAGYTFCCRYDREFTLTQLGTDFTSLAGYSPEELESKFGNKLSRMILPEDRERSVLGIRDQLRSGTSATVEFRVRHKDGRILWMMDKLRLYTGADGQEYLSCFLTDISTAKREVELIHKKLQQYEIILAQTENVLFEWDMVTDRISFSDTWETIFGFNPISQNVFSALKDGSYFHPDDLPLLLDRISNVEQGSDYEMVEVRIATARGRYIWCRFRASAVRDDKGKLLKIVGIIINIDAEKQAERALQDQAERDSLTKLLNNYAARKRSEEYFLQLGTAAHCAMLIIDLDDFKLVNDRYGHLFGDSVLSRVAKEIRKLFRNQDIIARIGGDEFMVLMRGISDRTIVESRCRMLVTALSSAFRSTHQQLPMSCSIGVSLAPEHGSTYIELFQKADQALYRAKSSGKNAYLFYCPDTAVEFSVKAYQTAVNRHIDSDTQPGLADSNIVQYAFQRLYTSQDVSAAIHDILDMVGRQTNVSRVYIFENSPDNRYCSNTYEWCNDGIEPEIEMLQNISYETDIPGYEDNFNEQGIFYCPDVKALPQKAYEIVEAQGIKSMLQCAIRDNGVFRGYIGFDECVTQRFWTKEQIQVLTYFSEMLSVFLLKKQEQARSHQRNADLASILDNQNAWIYIIDPDSCELKYLNAKTRSLAADVQPGMRCYEALMGRSSRCENCPSRNIRQNKTQSTMIENPVFCLNVLAEATLIQWEGTESCLLTCRETAGSAR